MQFSSRGKQRGPQAALPYRDALLAVNFFFDQLYEKAKNLREKNSYYIGLPCPRNISI